MRVCDLYENWLHCVLWMGKNDIEETLLEL